MFPHSLKDLDSPLTLTTTPILKILSSKIPNNNHILKKGSNIDKTTWLLSLEKKINGVLGRGISLSSIGENVIS